MWMIHVCPQDPTWTASQMMAWSVQLHAEAMDAQRVARNYAKAAKRALTKVQELEKAGSLTIVVTVDI